MMKERNFTLGEKNALQEQLLTGSITIRDAFMPWIDKGEIPSRFDSTFDRCHGFNGGNI